MTSSCTCFTHDLLRALLCSASAENNGQCTRCTAVCTEVRGAITTWTWSQFWVQVRVAIAPHTQTWGSVQVRTQFMRFANRTMDSLIWSTTQHCSAGQCWWTLHGRLDLHEAITICATLWSQETMAPFQSAPHPHTAMVCNSYVHGCHTISNIPAHH